MQNQYSIMNCKFLKKLTILFLTGIFIASNSYASQDDTIKVQQVTVKPVFDGVATDDVWNAEGVNWQLIDQVWMPWKGTVPTASDFSGRFKFVWHESENLLFFFVEITDDVFIDGYNFATNGPFGYPNYDVVEIFLDENRSKGPHVFDNGTENAQNAFSYHINLNAPADGTTTDVFTVQDLDGRDWGNSWVVNYAAHFPDFVMKKEGNKYLYEFSLKVFNDAYPTQQKNGTTSTNIEESRITLTPGKIMGISLAYCDNDANDGKRDHFFGSMAGKEYTGNFGYNGTQNSISTENGQKIFNTHWMSASDYGVAELMKSGVTSIKKEPNLNRQKVTIFPSQITSNLNITINEVDTGPVKVELYNLAGIRVAEFLEIKNDAVYKGSFSVVHLVKGVYVTKVMLNNYTSVQKIIKL